MNEVRIGTAGWTVPKQHAALFADEGSHLQKSASRLRCVEINSSFHRPHMLKTWERWARETPEDFRFAVKVPKTITHTAKLIDTGALLVAFLEQVSGLGAKLGPLLVQLPPKLAYDEGVAHEFLTTLRELHTGAVVLEPRHVSWFAPEIDRMLRGFEVARVAADPPKGSPLAGKPGGWNGLRYWRLHGAPKTYYSEYSSAFLKGFAKELKESTRASETWVIFDNTALGHGAANAVELQRCLLGKRS
ncbi:DUF72 domain-containing protein [Granulicella cerasi]|uniref:DUF72 domain-containing protein n=1 Tax=Granulicella cerasi TaxID=741063 RepID=A0ABW1Z9X9_9BACT|nr:DUF72 domain-containing protein [Granulicella cerasi]